MLWPALNPLSIHVTFTAIVPGSYPLPRGGQNMQKCAKMANFWTYGLNYWETVECVHAAMHLTSIESYFSSMWHLSRLSHTGAYPVEAKMCQTGKSRISPPISRYYLLYSYLYTAGEQISSLNRKVAFGYLISWWVSCYSSYLSQLPFWRQYSQWQAFIIN